MLLLGLYAIKVKKYKDFTVFLSDRIFRYKMLRW